MFIAGGAGRLRQRLQSTDQVGPGGSPRQPDHQPGPDHRNVASASL